MNLENIIVIGVCLAAIAIATYYFYNKYSSQKKDLLDLTKRCEIIEMILTKPPSQHDLSNVYNRSTRNNSQQPSSALFQEPSKSILNPQKCEVEGLCDLQPFQVETNDAEIDEIVADELSKVTSDEKIKKIITKTK